VKRIAWGIFHLFSFGEILSTESIRYGFKLFLILRNILLVKLYIGREIDVCASYFITLATVVHSERKTCVCNPQVVDGLVY